MAGNLAVDVAQPPSAVGAASARPVSKKGAR